MISVYEIKFRTVIEFSMEQDDEDIEMEPESKVQVGIFHLGCECLTDAVLKAIEFLDGWMEDNEYEIMGVELCDHINLVNFPEEECPFCDVEGAAEDDILRFKCWCGQDIVVKETGWKEIECPECGKEIPRDRLIGGHGNYILLDIKGE